MVSVLFIGILGKIYQSYQSYYLNRPTELHQSLEADKIFDETHRAKGEEQEGQIRLTQSGIRREKKMIRDPCIALDRQLDQRIKGARWADEIGDYLYEDAERRHQLSCD